MMLEAVATSVGVLGVDRLEGATAVQCLGGQHLVLFVPVVLSRPLSFTNNDLHHALDAVLSACIRSPAAADSGPLLLH
jgi:hypothetical protein